MDIRLHSVLPAICILLFLSAPICIFAINPEDPVKDRLRSVRTGPARDLPWKPLVRSRPRVIYGHDDRMDVYQTDNMRLQVDAASTCALVSSADITDNGDETWTIQLSTYVNPDTGNPPCDGEPFADQPTAAFCTGWLAGDYLIATAGHCYNSADLADTWFVFGFHMLNMTTPVMVVDDSQVYRGIEIVSTNPSGDHDHAVVRVDRFVEAVNARPMRISRVGGSQSGTFPAGSRAGVMGHPAGLPLKVAFGNATVVLANDPLLPYFQANLDTYGGNSGSPVFNVFLGIVEGVLVKGAMDYVDNGTCFVSNVLPNNGFGEECTKTSIFEHVVAEPDGIYFSKAVFSAPGHLDLLLFDSNLTGMDPLEIEVSSSVDDIETIMISNVAEGVWSGQSMLGNANTQPVPGDEVLQIAHDGYIRAAYSDADRGDGQPWIRHDFSNIDAIAPTISNIDVISIGSDMFMITLETDESARVFMHYGITSGQPDATISSNFGTVHSFNASGLDSCTTYYFKFGAGDLAGNQSLWNDGGTSHVTTVDQVIQFEEDFESQEGGWSHSSDIGGDNWDIRTSVMPVSPHNVFSYSPGMGTIADARLVTDVFEAGGEFSFYHRYDIEPAFDGLVLEISNDLGQSWSDLEDHITGGGYTSTISTMFQSPILGQNAWSGDESGPMTQVRVDLSSFSGMVQVAFRFTSDSSIPSGFWEIDDIKIGQPVSCVPETLRVISPNGGESFTGGSQVDVWWISNTENAGTAVRIDLWDSQGYIDVLGIDWSVAGENTIPIYMPLLPESLDYRIRIVSLWEPKLSDTSDAGFGVTGGPVAMNRPNGGEIWNTGEIQLIHWQASTLFAGTGFYFELWNETSMVSDLGFGWDPDGEGIHTVVVPEVPSGNNYRVRVISTWDKTSLDASDAVFTIINPSDSPTDTAVSPGSWLLYGYD